MREVVLVMPYSPNTRQEIACEALREWLAVEYGRFSEYWGQGAWRDSNHKTIYEPHLRFVVAVRDEAMAEIVVDQLRHEAQWAGEKAIYYVDTRGEAHVESLEGEKNGA